MKRIRFVAGSAALIAALACGCGVSRGYFPLEVGKVWTYHVRAGLAITVEDVKVERRTAVAGTVGYEVGGPLGYSRLAWKSGVLMADALPNTRFSPPLPILVPGDPATVREVEPGKPKPPQKAVRVWQGALETMGRSQTARAELFQEESTLELATRKYPALKATLRVLAGGKTLELTTWYVDGMGPLRQEQQTNGVQDVGLEYLGGA